MKKYIIFVLIRNSEKTMEGSGTCVACGASDVELNAEQKCANCAGAPAAAPAEGGDTPMEGGDMAGGSSEGGDMPAEGGDMPAAE